VVPRAKGRLCREGQRRAKSLLRRILIILVLVPFRRMTADHATSCEDLDHQTIAARTEALTSIKFRNAADKRKDR
jgi:hypothetical protein